MPVRDDKRGVQAERIKREPCEKHDFLDNDTKKETDTRSFRISARLLRPICTDQFNHSDGVLLRRAFVVSAHFAEHMAAVFQFAVCISAADTKQPFSKK